MKTIFVVGGADPTDTGRVLMLAEAGSRAVSPDNPSTAHGDAAGHAEFVSGDLADATILIREIQS